MHLSSLWQNCRFVSVLFFFEFLNPKPWRLAHTRVPTGCICVELANQNANFNINTNANANANANTNANAKSKVEGRSIFRLCIVICNASLMRPPQNYILHFYFQAMVWTFFLLEKWGRKPAIGLQLLIAGAVFLILSVCTSREWETFLLFIVRGCISGGFQSAYVYVANAKCK